MKNRIKQIRKQKNISQTMLANAINTTRANISLYENNKREPNLETWLKISEVLKTSVPYLQGLTPKYHTKTIVQMLQSSYIKSLTARDLYLLRLNSSINQYLFISGLNDKPLPTSAIPKNNNLNLLNHDHLCSLDFWETTFSSLLHSSDFSNFRLLISQSDFSKQQIIRMLAAIIDDYSLNVAANCPKKLILFHSFQLEKMKNQLSSPN